MPGSGLAMDGAMQQAPQPGRHSMGVLLIDSIARRVAAREHGVAQMRDNDLHTGQGIEELE
jgi:hypothetical protein